MVLLGQKKKKQYCSCDFFFLQITIEDKFS